MKKNHANRRIMPRPPLTKLLRIMKLTAILILLATTTVSAAGYSQDAKVTLRLEGVKLTKFFKVIEKATGYRFAFSNDILPSGKIVSIDVKDEPVSSVMQTALKNTNLKYRFDDQTGIIVISEKFPVDPEVSDGAGKMVKIISGRVTNDKGEPLAGVTVQVKGTTTYTTTATDGSFSINAPDNATTLIFSYVDMESQEVSIVGRSVLAVQMNSMEKALSEVVVVGYGTEVRKKLTSAVSTVSTKGLQEIPATSLSNLIAGRAPGVTITTVGGRPGTTSSLRIRGASTGGVFGGTTEPLYVIDNVISNKELFDLLDINEVSDISILKDAAATALYGSRAANGVVVVKTKSGSKGKPTLQLTATTGFSEEVRRPKYTTAYEQALLTNQAINARATDPNITQNSNQGTTPISKEVLDYLKANVHPNFQDAVRITPRFNRYALNVSGGTDVVDYFIGGNYVEEGGTLPNLNYKKYGVRGNVGIKITENLKATLNANFTKDDDFQFFWPFDGESLSDSYRQMGRRGNWVPAFINGLPVANFNAFNPADFALNKGNGTRDRTTDLSNFILDLEYKVPFVKGLSAGVTYNRRHIVNNGTVWQKPNVAYIFESDPTNPFKLTNKVIDKRVRAETGVDANSLTKSTVTDRFYQLNARINYDRTFGNHAVKGTFVYEQSEISRDQFSATRRNLLSPDLQQLFATGNRPEDRAVSGSAAESGRLSYVGSLSYSYKNRYFLNAAARVDGSVFFIDGKRYGTFPSVSAAWILSEENFFDKILFIDLLKLRASFGRTGNDNYTGSDFPNYSYLGGYTISGTPFVLGSGGTSVNVISAAGFPTVDLTWDKTNSYNVGTDVVFLKNRLTVSVDVFKNRRYDLFGSRISTTPIELGANPPAVNYGIVDVKGFEVIANYRQSIGELSYNIGFNFGYAKDKIIKFDENAALRAYQRRSGYNSDRIFGFIADDIIRTQKQLDDLIAKGYKFNNNNPYLGMVLIRDIRGNQASDPNGNTPDGKIDDNDRTWIASHSSPPINYGFTLGLSYMGFSVEAFIQGLEGHKKMVPATGRFYFDVVSEGGWATWNDAFEPTTNPNGKMPRFVPFATNGGATFEESTFWLRNAGFARLKNLNVAYKVPVRLSRKVGIKGASVFYNGSNLFFIYSRIKEFDPELQGEGIPVNRTHSFGIQLSL